MNKVKMIREWCDRVESCRYPGYSAEYIVRQLVWLYRFKHIDRKTFDELADRVTYILETYKPD